MTVRSASASAAAGRSASRAASTAPAATTPWPIARPGTSARAAARPGSWTRQPASASCARGPASAAAGKSGGPAARSAACAWSKTGGPLPSSPVRGAASPAGSAPPPAGAGTAPTPAGTPSPDTACRACGLVTHLEGDGLCFPCYTRSPHRITVRAENLAARLSDPPPWLPGFADYLVPRHNATAACQMITDTGRLLRDGGPVHPQSLLERAAARGGPLARALEDFFTSHGLALPPDHAERRAAARRQRRLDAIPAALRPAATAFTEHELAGRRQGPACPDPAALPQHDRRPPHLGARPRTVPHCQQGHHQLGDREYQRRRGVPRRPALDGRSPAGRAAPVLPLRRRAGG